MQSIEKTTRTAQEITKSQQRAFGALTDNFVSFQRRNAEVARGWSGFLKLQESNARAAQDLFTSAVRSASEQQESARELAEQWASTYENFFSSWGSYAEEGLKSAQQLTEQGLESADRTARQGLRVAEQAAEQTEKAVRQADPNQLPIEGYDELNASEVGAKLENLTAAELKKVEAYEKRNKNRETVVEQIERKMKAVS